MSSLLSHAKDLPRALVRDNEFLRSDAVYRGMQSRKSEPSGRKNSKRSIFYQRRLPIGAELELVKPPRPPPRPPRPPPPYLLLPPPPE
jgi:hypothetical protein